MDVNEAGESEPYVRRMSYRNMLMSHHVPYASQFGSGIAFRSIHHHLGTQALWVGLSNLLWDP